MFISFFSNPGSGKFTTGQPAREIRPIRGLEWILSEVKDWGMSRRPFFEDLERRRVGWAFGAGCLNRLHLPGRRQFRGHAYSGMWRVGRSLFWMETYKSIK